MRVFVCQNRITDIATGIYEAWEYGMHYGHDQLRICKGPIEQRSFFEEYTEVCPDEEKAEKVLRSIRNKISMEAYIMVYYAALYRIDVLQEIYEFLRLGFSRGKEVVKFLQHPAVMKLLEAKRAVGNEIHYYREFARFDLFSGVLISHLEPKNQVVELVGYHFADRMPSENWIIVDDKRKLAVVHLADRKIFLQTLTEEEFIWLSQTEAVNDEYSSLWNTFFNTTAIEQRRNPNCQRNHFPLWMRKHATEFRNQ